VGRYFYSRIHYGLHGRKANLEYLCSDTAALRGCMKHVFDEVPALRDRLVRLERKTRELPQGFLGSLGHVLHISLLSRWHAPGARRQLRDAIVSIRSRNRFDDDTIASLGEISSFYLRAYLEAIRRVAGFGFYERLFSLWHVLHMPLFIMLLLTGTIHVVAVHMY